MKEKDLASTVRETISRRGMIARGERLLVAVSGGPDSVAMLSALLELAPELAIWLHVFHLNHNLRKSAGADADFVAELVTAMNLPATIISFDVAGYCREQGCGIETGAREVRYRLMEEIAQQVGAAKIATGHTLDDQVETFLMRLLRGAGPGGLRAIPPVRGRFIRPLIDATRSQVLEWCAARGAEFRVDETNNIPDQPRNLLRLEIVPALRRLNPNLHDTIARTIEILTEEDEYMLGATIEAFNETATKVGGSIRVDRAAFESLPTAIGRRVLRLAVDTLEPEAPPVEAAQVEEVLRQMRAGADFEVHISGGLQVFGEHEHIVIAKRATKTPQVRARLSVPGRTEVPELGLVVEARVMERSRLESVPSNELTVAVDADRLAGALVVTTPKPGDRFRPLGMAGTKKLSDFFVDGKVPKRDRAKVPIVRCDESIVWVVGMRIDERYRIGDATERVLLIETMPEVRP